MSIHRVNFFFCFGFNETVRKTMSIEKAGSWGSGKGKLNGEGRKQTKNPTNYHKFILKMDILFKFITYYLPLSSKSSLNSRISSLSPQTDP